MIISEFAGTTTFSAINALQTVGEMLFLCTVMESFSHLWISKLLTGEYPYLFHEPIYKKIPTNKNGLLNIPCYSKCYNEENKLTFDDVD